jgi:16S rRNA (uracil1498-N3)-methyltransferase
VPLICERAVAAAELSERKLERWRRLVREAAEQSRRGRLPVIVPLIPFEAACAAAVAQGPALFLWEGAGALSLREAIATHALLSRPVAIFSGPEGGWSQAELEIARGYGIIAVTLGPRTLRAETAPIVAMSVLRYELRDLE